MPWERPKEIAKRQKKKIERLNHQTLSSVTLFPLPHWLNHYFYFYCYYRKRYHDYSSFLRHQTLSGSAMPSLLCLPVLTLALRPSEGPARLSSMQSDARADGSLFFPEAPTASCFICLNDSPGLSTVATLQTAQNCPENSWPHPWHVRFLGQRSNPHHSSDLSHSSNNTGSLTC